MKGKRLGKRDQKELMEKEKEHMKKFINDLKNAALDDMVRWWDYGCMLAADDRRECRKRTRGGRRQ